MQIMEFFLNFVTLPIQTLIFKIQRYVSRRNGKTNAS